MSYKSNLILVIKTITCEQKMLELVILNLHNTKKNNNIIKEQWTNNYYMLTA